MLRKRFAFSSSGLLLQYSNLGSSSSSSSSSYSRGRQSFPDEQQSHEEESHQTASRRSYDNEDQEQHLHLFPSLASKQHHHHHHHHHHQYQTSQGEGSGEMEEQFQQQGGGGGGGGNEQEEEGGNLGGGGGGENFGRTGGKIGRERAQEQLLANQFSSLHGGWQSSEDKRFDLFVEEKRRQAAFDEFDQRVQRAFSTAVRQHRVEVWNGFKRQLKRTGDKLTPKVLQDVNRALGDRETWLKEVFHGIDADYRSGDVSRQRRATTDLRSVLDGRSGELLQSHYENKLENRFAGPRGRKLAQQVQEDDTDAPSISSDEVNRYANLRPNISAVEDRVLRKYGRAGKEHWDILQSEKDAEYSKKLSDAAEIYQGLIEQQTAYDEAVSQQPIKDYVRRLSRAQVRFRTAMEIEATREQLVEAHEFMQKQRAEDAQKRRSARLQAALEMKKSGVPTEQVKKMIQKESLDHLNEQLSNRVAMEKDQARARKKKFMTMIDQLEYDAERREGEDELGGEYYSSSSSSSAQDSLFGSSQKSSSSSVSPSTTSSSSNVDLSDSKIQQVLEKTRRLAESLQEQQQQAESDDATRQYSSNNEASVNKKALWHVLNEDRWEDPFHVVHSARVQANKTYSELYSLSQPTKLRLGRKSTRGDATQIRGAGEESKMLLDPWIDQQAFLWGMNSKDIHDLDDDPKKSGYVADIRGWHVRDPNTRDIDFRYEKKLGRGARWTGPKFYKMGIDAQGKDYDRPMREDASGSSVTKTPSASPV